MKCSSALLVVAAAAAATLTHAQDGSFSAAEKALWVDRHNYFRMTALPFSAGNMLRVKWSDELAAAALAAAKGCATVSGAGVNAHTHVASASGSVIDAAITEWAVNGAYSALAKIKAPSKDGEPVGTGVYNSYSQIVWAATNSVGCGYSTCAAGKLVVCKYSAPGNSANEPWYVHAPPNTQCPAGTEGKQGLCIVAGDAGNNDIAPIPAGQNAYAVFASFIGNMQKVLLGQKVDGGPMSGGTGASTNPATTATPGAAAATTTAPSAGTGTTTTTTSSPAVTEAAGTKTPATAGSSTSDSTTTSATTQSPSAMTTSGSTGGGATKSIDFGSLTTSASDAPGKVNAGSNTGTTFSNATPSTAAGGAATSSSAAKKTQKADAAADESVAGGSGTANNKSDGGDEDGSGGFSAAGVAGAIVVGCVMVAGVFVFVSYRKNQQRQRDIMQNGGIHIL